MLHSRWILAALIVAAPALAEPPAKPIIPPETAAPEGAEAAKGLGQFIVAVHQQDIEACESVWAGLNTRHFESGPLSALEKPIWQFNRWWIDRMTGD